MSMNIKQKLQLLVAVSIVSIGGSLAIAELSLSSANDAQVATDAKTANDQVVVLYRTSFRPLQASLERATADTRNAAQQSAEKARRARNQANRTITAVLVFILVLVVGCLADGRRHPAERLARRRGGCGCPLARRAGSEVDRSGICIQARGRARVDAPARACTADHAPERIELLTNCRHRLINSEPNRQRQA